MVDQDEKKVSRGPSDYVCWYRMAKEVFGNLIPSLSNQEILQQAPQRGRWFPIPLSSERGVKDVANRPDPHIDFKLMGNQTIRIGMRCNTIASVEKMKNILHELHTSEKQKFVYEMRQLDNSFQTQVLTKIKETNYAQVDGYTCEFNEQSNLIDDQTIQRIFQKTDEIREVGIRRLKDEKLKLNPETPVLDIIYTTCKQNPEEFKNKLKQIKNMYQICLSIKTTAELQKEVKRNKKLEQQCVTKFRCPKCGKEYPPSSDVMRFCDADGMRIITVTERATNNNCIIQN